MARRSRWTESSIVAGYGEVKLLTWRYFFDFIHQEMLEHQSYVWRGQRNDDWLLDSTLDRLTNQTKIAKSRRYLFRENHLQQFKFASRGRRGSSPRDLVDENDWWALGQHYGLATPLLDWTTSPFVAAYFAFIEQGSDQTPNRAIYALHKPTIEKRVNKKVTAERKRRQEEKTLIDNGKKKAGLLSRAMLDSIPRSEIDFIRPMSDENQRLVNQGGLFTRAPDDVDLKSWVQDNFPDESSGYNLIKIIIPNKDRESCLKGLNRMNINHLTLFPDLQGASIFCNLSAKIKQY